MALLLKPGTRIAAEKPIYSRSCNIFVFNDEQSCHVQTLETKQLETGAVIEPFLSVDHDEGQLLFDALYDAGYRRHDDVDTTGEVAALQRNLDDLRGTINGQGGIIDNLFRVALDVEPGDLDNG